jgi:phage regulator Rha-like protein
MGIAPLRGMSQSLVPKIAIEEHILLIRGQRVMLDSTLAELYGVDTKILNKAVQRNRDRFPPDFAFQLTYQELTNLRFQIGTSRSHGGRRYHPYVFTQEGVAMLSSVLRSKRAIQINIEIMRAFVRLKKMVSSHRELADKIDKLERKYDVKFKAVFDAIRQLMQGPKKSKRSIGF